MGSDDVRAPHYGFGSMNGAEFSADRLHRFLLWRIWSPPPGKLLGFVMLNPSIADETRDDPTTTRNCARARLLGYAGIVQANLYSFRTPSPKVLKESGYQGGVHEYRANAVEITRLAEKCRDIVLAWGAHARSIDADSAISLLRHTPTPPGPPRLLHLGQNANGAPRHPLMTAYGQPPDFGLKEWS